MENEYNEKLSWKNQTLIAGVITASMLFSTLRNSFKKDTSRYIYSEIIKNNLESQDMEKIIDSIRNVMVKEIKMSKYDNKQMMIDTINNMPIFIVNTKNNIEAGHEEISGCYILPELNDIGRSIILLDEHLINNRKELTETLIHELYHYIKFQQKEVHKEKLDKNITLRKAVDKFSILLSGLKFDELDTLIDEEKDVEIVKGLKQDIFNMTYDMWKYKKYYTDEDEFYARYMTLKHKILDAKLIENINDDLDSDIIFKYTENCSIEDLTILIFIDWSDF